MGTVLGAHPRQGAFTTAGQGGGQPAFAATFRFCERSLVADDAPSRGQGRTLGREADQGVASLPCGAAPDMPARLRVAAPRPVLAGRHHIRPPAWFAIGPVRRCTSRVGSAPMGSQAAGLGVSPGGDGRGPPTAGCRPRRLRLEGGCGCRGRARGRRGSGCCHALHRGRNTLPPPGRPGSCPPPVGSR